MAQLNVNNTRDLLQSFDFQRLFLQELGWEKPSVSAPRTWIVAGRDLQGREIASLAGVSVLEITSPDGEIPDSKARLAIWREIAKVYHENLLIFVDGQRSQSLWYWVKRGEKGKVHPRDHYFYKDQPGDLFLSKLASLVIDVADLDESARPNVLDIAQRLRGGGLPEGGVVEDGQGGEGFAVDVPGAEEARGGRKGFQPPVGRNA